MGVFNLGISEFISEFNILNLAFLLSVFNSFCFETLSSHTLVLDFQFYFSKSPIEVRDEDIYSDSDIHYLLLENCLAVLPVHEKDVAMFEKERPEVCFLFSIFAHNIV
jgi:hypothetical protein